MRIASIPGAEIGRLDLAEAGRRANYFLKNGHQDIALLSFFRLVADEVRLDGMLRPNHDGGPAILQFVVDCLAVADHMHESAHRLCLGRVARNACRAEQFGGGALCSKPHRKHWFAPWR